MLNHRANLLIYQWGQSYLQKTSTPHLYATIHLIVSSHACEFGIRAKKFVSSQCQFVQSLSGLLSFFTMVILLFKWLNLRSEIIFHKHCLCSPALAFLDSSLWKHYFACIFSSWHKIIPQITKYFILLYFIDILYWCPQMYWTFIQVTK